MTKITMLNSMAGRDFADSLDQHRAWGLTHLDLKDSIWGKSLIDLTDDEAKRATELIRERELTTYCFSTVLFHSNIESGEAEFRANHLGAVDRIITLAKIMQPRIIRLLGAATEKRKELTDTIPYIKSNHPWLIPMYGEAIDRISDAGFPVTIENETGNCIFGYPHEILAFFDELGRREKVSFTWDVQNLWEVGTFPSIEVYHQLKDLIGYYHIKGGQHDGTSTKLCWQSTLEDASWPVLEITKQVIADGVSPVICLNPSHGKPKEGYDYSNVTKRNLDFLRREIPEVE